MQHDRALNTNKTPSLARAIAFERYVDRDLGTS